ncbi:MAG: hypothetical protein HY898_31835 [Deltaproteobacteria bacterium]|nr:hypothetical protein [Deltaproteobacteria bacterium]
MALAPTQLVRAAILSSLLAISCGGSTDNLFTPGGESGAGGADGASEAAAGSGGSVTPDGSADGWDGTVPEAGQDASPEVGQDGDASKPDASCGPTLKLCNGACVAVNDPSYGCAPDSCGPCTAPHGTASCANEKCTISICESGWADCDGNPSNGCETSTIDDLSNCGGCAMSCSFPHADAKCSGGVCSVSVCNMGFSDCDANPANGCEVALQIDPANCGACGTQCATPHAQAACYGAKCAVGACDVGWDNCNNDAGDGCETNISSDPVHCSACNVYCTEPPNASAACTAGQCSLGACNAGFANCDANGANGCEVNTLTDATNCGACGNVCGTGGCQAGQCSAPTTPVVVSTGGANPYDIAVDAQNVYWSSASGVSRAPKTGGSPVVLTPGASANGIAIDALRVYFSDNVEFAIKSVPLGGGTVTTLWSGSSHPWRLTTNGTSVFFTDDSASTVNKVPTTGGAMTVIASGQTGAAGIARDSTSLYWTTQTDGTVMKMPILGGAIVTLASGESSPVRVAVDATSAYFSCYTSTGAIRKVPLGGGTVTTLAASQASPIAVAVDSGWVYWTDASAVKKMPVGGGATVVLAPGQQQPNSLALDATRVYWTNFGDGTVMAVAK